MRVVVTGGAGFIGSHIGDSYLREGHEVVVLDDLSTGFESHVPTGAMFVKGDVSDLELVRSTVEGAALVIHQAASRAVLRSVEDPVGTERVNTIGTLNVLLAARDAGVKRVLHASSSSVYGGASEFPTGERAPKQPRSPYAVSKLAAEHYARVFWELYGLETVALRYFNVFGPRQRPDSQYAAVIPLFVEALANGESPVIYGDGRQSRDFTFISDVVRANHLAARADADVVSGNVYNVGRGGETDLLELLGYLRDIVGVDVEAVHDEPRPGDVRRSRADISSARRDLGYEPEVTVEEGLRQMVDWYRQWGRC